MSLAEFNALLFALPLAVSLTAVIVSAIWMGFKNEGFQFSDLLISLLMGLLVFLVTFLITDFTLQKSFFSMAAGTIKDNYGVDVKITTTKEIGSDNVPKEPVWVLNSRTGRYEERYIISEDNTFKLYKKDADQALVPVDKLD